ncbi:MAG: histidinol dehydrogenase, partial [Clostridiales bacterium]|nr:histidinol dehydrogenase [Clostridiales bacterium]
MELIYNDTPEGKGRIKKILERSQLEFGDVQKTVDEIIASVKRDGDAALFAYGEQFDGVLLDSETIQVTTAEIEAAYQRVDADLLAVIRRASARIRDFHAKQKQNSWFDPAPNGEILGQMIRPLENVGVYVPGGKAAYPSSVLMNIIPAQIAGVKNIIMTTPERQNAKIDPLTIVAAKEAGVTEIYKIGGAQAIAALAHGTESVPKVDKIVGPGNIYVALAKRSVYGYVNIDSVAGPSEILIIADETANPKFVAADLLSQAEHDEMASSVLITTSETLAQSVLKALETQTAALSRKEIIQKSLDYYGAVVITKTLEEAADLSNKIAPEHLELCVLDPFALLPKINNAGAVFMGHYTPEPLGDYMAGPNHVLPTGGTARLFSPLSVDDFIKKSSILSFG